MDAWIEAQVLFVDEYKICYLSCICNQISLRKQTSASSFFRIKAQALHKLLLARYTRYCPLNLRDTLKQNKHTKLTFLPLNCISKRLTELNNTQEHKIAMFSLFFQLSCYTALLSTGIPTLADSPGSRCTQYVADFVS